MNLEYTTTWIDVTQFFTSQRLHLNNYIIIFLLLFECVFSHSVSNVTGHSKSKLKTDGTVETDRDGARVAKEEKIKKKLNDQTTRTKWNFRNRVQWIFEDLLYCCCCCCSRFSIIYSNRIYSPTRIPCYECFSRMGRAHPRIAQVPMNSLSWVNEKTKWNAKRAMVRDGFW